MKIIRNKRGRVGRRTLWEKLRFRYTISVVNENELKEVRSLRISQIGVIATIFIYTGIVVGTTIWLYRSGPMSRKSEQTENVMRQTLIDDALRVDSLEHMVALQNHYIRNIQDILLGSVGLDTVYSVDSLTKMRSEELMNSTESERQFIERYEAAERYNVSSPISVDNKIHSFNMIRPTRGIISRPFNVVDSHLGVDVASTPQESVVAIMDGTVIVSTYAADEGYMIALLHPEGLMSLYMNCESLLKKHGDRVRQGDVVGLVSGSHLHFELWYEGQPLDPEKYIIF